jgi:lysophospholipase L1-like esterase
MISVNNSIKSYLEKKENTVFVDIWPAMLTKEGLPDESLFIADKLHMTPKGYAIWQKAIAPYLLK